MIIEKKVMDSQKILLILNSPVLKKAEAMELKKQVLLFIKSGGNSVSLDLSRTEEIDSSGVSKLLFLNKKLKNMGGELSLCNVHQKLLGYLDSLALTGIVSIHR